MNDTVRKLAEVKDVEATMLKFAEHLKYPLSPPKSVSGRGQQHVLLMNYLPDLPETLAYHFTALGWRWHPELAVIKQRRIIGGLFDDLVTYVPLDQPDDPIVVQQDPAPNPDPDLWSVKAKVNIIDEERSQE